jgi:hypothetical protein
MPVRDALGNDSDISPWPNRSRHPTLVRLLLFERPQTSQECRYDSRRRAKVLSMTDTHHQMKGESTFWLPTSNRGTLSNFKGRKRGDLDKSYVDIRPPHCTVDI